MKRLIPFFRWGRRQEIVTDDDVKGYLKYCQHESAHVTHKIAKFDNVTPNHENETGKNIPWGNKSKKNDTCGYRFFLASGEPIPTDPEV